MIECVEQFWSIFPKESSGHGYSQFLFCPFLEVILKSNILNSLFETNGWIVIENDEGISTSLIEVKS